MTLVLVAFGLILAIFATAYGARNSVTLEGFYQGIDKQGRAPDLWTLVLSQVTTWIFARSLLNAAILGYYYGIAGTLAYATYYASFLTGGYVVLRLRAGGATSVQAWLSDRFGQFGTGSYNAVIALRLLSEVFANLLVIGLIFGVLLPNVMYGKEISIAVVALLTLVYSAWGGLRASLKTDVWQMVIFAIVFVIAFVYMVFSANFSWGAVLTSSGASGAYNGWILLLVAILQVPSYPLHDPVMMDRGFLANEVTTKKSFLHAFWISALFIIGFGLFGIYAAEQQAAIENDLLGTWSVLFPAPIFAALLVSLLVSGVSTLDSALASSARLMVEELKLFPRSLAGGRLAMVLFLVLGAILTLWGNATLFDAVAVSGTASMFLTPIVVVGLIWGRGISNWAYGVNFAAASAGAVLYFARGADWAKLILPEAHKYEQLLLISVVVLIIGFVVCVFGMERVAQRQKG